MSAFYDGCTEQDLDLWIECNMRVLFEGYQGVGKTSMVTAAFERNFGHFEKDEKGGKIWIPGERNKDYLYFSAPTLDPWVDFIGVPHVTKEIINGVPVEFLGLLRPEYMVRHEPQGIFIDEINRAGKKVRNALMELIQFGSINGHKFKNLRCVWAAINPEDDPNMAFDVEPLDPALKDRFQIQISLPYQPDEMWFAAQFGREVAKAAISWWSKLEQPVKFKVSPRRLEYAIRGAQMGLNIRQMLPKESNPATLISLLKVGMPEEKFREFLKDKNVPEMRKFLAKPNMFDAVQRFIVVEHEARSFCLQLLDSERLTVLLSKHNSVKEEILSHPGEYRELIRELARGAQNIRLKDECLRLLPIIKEIEEKIVNGESLDSAGQVSLDVKGLPEMVTQEQVKKLRANYEIVSESDFKKHKMPHISIYRNEQGNTLVEAYKGDVDSEIESIALFCRVSCTNNYYRTQMIERVAAISIREDLNKSQVESCLRFAEFFAAHSHDKTVCSNTLFALLMNELVVKYREECESLSSEELFKLVPNVYYRYFGNPSINREEPNIRNIMNNLIIRLKKGALQPYEDVTKVSI